ncbi:hypothetical protein BASA81_012247 [Batrachochytrium salamandrivorans]|nr:hypothetical protein BASA62_000446 [Batrachochytrium salamandrivorans]KAH9249943.1 hypothetical protein BASA81_012247 [Batrachochytrium salamandrivorans]
MKLVSFAVVSFLAATVSAGFSATLGNADDNIHRLEKRGIIRDTQKKLQEEIKQVRAHYKEILDEYLGMKRREGHLQDNFFRLKFELNDSSYKSPKGNLANRCNMAQALYESQKDACYQKYKSVMIAKEKLQTKVGEGLMWKYNLQQLREHNKNYPNDLWKVTSPAYYNKKILSDQISASCKSVERSHKLEDKYEAESEKIYKRWAAFGPDVKLLEQEYIAAAKNLESVKEEVWMNIVTCTHMTDFYQKLFGARK